VTATSKTDAITKAGAAVLSGGMRRNRVLPDVVDRSETHAQRDLQYIWTNRTYNKSQEQRIPLTETGIALKTDL